MSLETVSADRLSKIFDRQRALWKVSLTARAGEILALLGPNGAGKSTLLGLLSTLSRPSEGRVLFDGHPTLGSEVRGRIGLVSHAPLTYPELTAVENVAFFAELGRVPRPRDAALTWLTRFGLEDAAHRPRSTFSRGMQQRLGLARAFVTDPEVVLLDEPFTGLDAPSSAIVEAEVRRLREARRVVVLTTHDIARAEHLADRAAILVRGRLVQEEVGPFAPGALTSALRAATEASP